MGFGIQIGPNCYTGEGIGISNKPELCGQEINDYYTSEKNDALISAAAESSCARYLTMLILTD